MANGLANHAAVEITGNDQIIGYHAASVCVIIIIIIIDIFRVAKTVKTITMEAQNSEKMNAQ